MIPVGIEAHPAQGLVSTRFMAAVLADAPWIALVLLAVVATWLIRGFLEQYRADRERLRKDRARLLCRERRGGIGIGPRTFPGEKTCPGWEA